MLSQSGISITNIKEKEIPNLINNIIYNEEEELEEKMEGTAKKVLFLYVKENESDDSNFLTERSKKWFTKLTEWLGIDKSQMIHCLLGPSASLEAAFREFMGKPYFTIKESKPDFVITLGKECAYSFFKKEFTKQENWFEIVHSRAHTKMLPGTEKGFTLFCLPSISICLDESLKESNLLTLKTLRGLLKEQEIVSKK